MTHNTTSIAGFRLDAADMTPQQRLIEVAAILAAGVLRLRRRGRPQENQEFCPAPLDVPPDSRLTVPRG
jgi:hypothetical protein